MARKRARRPSPEPDASEPDASDIDASDPDDSDPDAGDLGARKEARKQIAKVTFEWESGSTLTFERRYDSALVKYSWLPSNIPADEVNLVTTYLPPKVSCLAYMINHDLDSILDDAFNPNSSVNITDHKPYSMEFSLMPNIFCYYFDIGTPGTMDTAGEEKWWRSKLNIVELPRVREALQFLADFGS